MNQQMYAPYSFSLVREFSVKFVVKIAYALTLVGLAFFSRPSLAQALIEIDAVPSSWLVQNYVPANLTLWFTGSSCNNGQLVFPSNAVQADEDRLVSMVLTAKATGQVIRMYYYVSNSACYISSFGIPN
jgi:hypothetical protein